VADGELDLFSLCCVMLAGCAAWISRSLLPTAALQGGTEKFPAVEMGRCMERDSSTSV